MNLAELIIKTQDAKSLEEKQELRRKYNASVRKKNKEHLEEVNSQIQ